MVVEHGPKGAIVVIPDTVMLIDDRTVETTLIHSGLPQRSFVDLISVSDGIAGAGSTEIVHHPSHEGWSMPSIDRYWLNLDPWGGSMIFRGGRSLDDLWLTQGSWAIRVHPEDHIDAFERLLIPQAGCWAHQTGNRFTVITDLEGYGGDRQVTWWNGSSPDRMLLTKDGLRFLVAFEDSVFVAIGEQTIGWRTTDQTHLTWEEVDIPHIDLGQQPRGQVKGRHGVVRGPRMKAWTHDAGSSWQVDSLPNIELVALANNGAMFHVWVEDQPGSEFSLVVDRQVGSERTVVAALPDSVFDKQRNNLVAAAYDDNEQRLYIATDHWVGSLSLTAVSAPDLNPEPLRSAVTLPNGYYDMFGRYLGEHLPEHAAAGLYLFVSERGVEKRLLSGHGFE